MHFRVHKAWFDTAVGNGNGTWLRKTTTFTSGISDHTIYFRYGMETDPYGYCDTSGMGNNSGSALDDIRLWHPSPPPPPAWTVTFESGMGSWTNNVPGPAIDSIVQEAHC
jgi:hypothetical protein